MLAPGLAIVMGRFVRELMLLLDGISVGGQSTSKIVGSFLYIPVHSCTFLYIPVQGFQVFVNAYPGQNLAEE